MFKEQSVGNPIPRSRAPTPIYMFRPAWRWTQKEIALMDRELIHPVLHVPCGVSDVGEVRVDIVTRADIKADMNRLPFRSKSFPSVLCDPPWINPKEWDMRWTRELGRIAVKRIILRFAMFWYTIPKPWKLKRSWFVVKQGTAVVNMWHVWELDGQSFLP